MTSVGLIVYQWRSAVFTDLRMAEIDRTRAAQLCSCASAKACVSLCVSLAISVQSAEHGWC